MILLKVLLLNLLAATCCLKVVNIQLFGAGKNGSSEIKHFADLIKSSNADVVIAQRGHAWNMDPLLVLPEYLGKRWSGAVHCSKYVAVYTPHKILNHTESVSSGINVKIQLAESGLVVSVWAMHLDWTFYHPTHEYFINKTLPSKTVYEIEKVRISQIVELLKHPQFSQHIKNSDRIPVIVAGEFNTNSHLDWTEGNKDLHNGHVVDWPVTKVLSGAAGMTDSYREVYPDASVASGYTEWHYGDGKTIHWLRDQYIFYRGSLRPITATNFDTATVVSHYSASKFTRQRAVQVEFEITPYKHENTPSFFIGKEFLRGTPITSGACKAYIL